MNSEIEKFWTHSGYYVETDVMLPCCDEPYILFWFLMKDERQLHCVGQSEPYDRNSKEFKDLKEKPPCTRYFLEGKEYSEEEMLRLIRQKAFF